MSHLLEVKNLDVKFDTDEGRITAVENISLSVDQGEVLGIVGESGSGKSVTAKSIMKLNRGNTKLFSLLNKHQLKDSKKMKFCDHIVVNNKSLPILKKQLYNIINLYE